MPPARAQPASRRRKRKPQVSARLERRIQRARKTGRVREFELMLALRPGRPAVVAEGDSWFAYPSRNLLGASSRSNIVNRLSRAARQVSRKREDPRFSNGVHSSTVSLKR